MAVSRYNRLPIAEKRAEGLARMRDAAVTCPECDTQVMPVDLLDHLRDRCPGKREPGPGSRWVTHAEVMQMGVPRATLSMWAARGFVRFVGGRMDRKYLHRDLALRIANWRGFRRR